MDSVGGGAVEARPIAGALGAEVRGVDLSRPLDDATFARVHRAFLDHLVIAFRDQSLTPEQHKAFGRRFGALSLDHFVDGMDGHPEIMVVVKEPGHRRSFGGVWHSDVTFQEAPSLGSILYARELPPVGGDTLFANMYLAYESLSAGMRELLDGLAAVHCAYPAYDPAVIAETYKHDRKMSFKPARDISAMTSAHPVVRTHPETGRKSLFVNSAYTIRFDGMTEQESRPLLDFLYQHARKPEFTCRFRWTDNAVVLWDNRCTQHLAINDFDGHRRVMHRVTIDGDRPA